LGNSVRICFVDLKFIYEYHDGCFVSVSTIDPKQLKKIRVQLGITQSELAKAAGVSQSLIAKLESGLVDPPSAR
jgi:DNA-binding transcriptional regulator YiaG